MSNQWKKANPEVSRTKHRIRGFLGKRYKWLAITGGLLLTITLTVRDTLRDEIRTLSDRIDNVARMDGLETIIVSMSTILVTLADEVHNNRLLSGGPKQTHNEQVATDYDLSTRRFTTEINNYDLALNRILDVASLLPTFKSSGLQELTDQTGQHITGFRDVLQRRTQYHPTNGKVGSPYTDDYMRQGLSLLVFETSRNERLILSEATGTRKLLERKYLFVNVGSYALIALALVLSVIGKAYDERSETDIEPG